MALTFIHCPKLIKWSRYVGSQQDFYIQLKDKLYVNVFLDNWDSLKSIRPPRNYRLSWKNLLNLKNNNNKKNKIIKTYSVPEFGSWWRPNSPQPSPPALPEEYSGVPKRDVIAQACSESFTDLPPQWTCLKHFTSGGSRGILTTKPYHLNWLLSLWRRSDSTPSPSQIMELLTLSVRDSSAILQRKFTSAAYIWSLILQSLPTVWDHRWGQERRLVSKQRVLPFGSVLPSAQ